MKKSLKILMIIVGIFLVIQLIPVDRSNPPVTNQIEWSDMETKAFFYRVCGDCHSNETKWPFYAYIAPVSWLISWDVAKGRKNFNISTGNLKEADEAAEKYSNGSMPGAMYLLMHSDAKLNEAQKSKFLNGLELTFGK